MGSESLGAASMEAGAAKRQVLMQALAGVKMTKTAAILLLLFFSRAAISETIKYEIPEDSALTFSKADTPNWLSFAGAAIISGVYQFHNDPDSPYGSPIYMYFYPDEQSQNVLPYLTDRGKPEKASEIFFNDGLAAARIILNESDAEKLKSGAVRYYSGKSTILIGNFSGGYECDSPTFMAEIVKEVKKIEAAKDVLIKENSGC